MFSSHFPFSHLKRRKHRFGIFWERHLAPISASFGLLGNPLGVPWAPRRHLWDLRVGTCFSHRFLDGFLIDVGWMSGLPRGLQNILKQVSIFCVAQVIREHEFCTIKFQDCNAAFTTNDLATLLHERKHLELLKSQNGLSQVTDDLSLIRL